MSEASQIVPGLGEPHFEGRLHPLKSGRLMQQGLCRDERRRAEAVGQAREPIRARWLRRT